MSDIEQFLEETWANLLSRRAKQVRRAYLSLDETGRQTVRHHLLRMASEESWHPEQVKSARAALRVLAKLD